MSNHRNIILNKLPNSVSVISSFIIFSKQLYPTNKHTVLQWFYFQLNYRSCSIMAGSFWTCTLRQNPLLVYQNQTCFTSSKGLIHNPSDPKPILPLLWENTNTSGTPNKKEWSHKLFSLIWANSRKKENISIKTPQLAHQLSQELPKKQQWLNPISVPRGSRSVFKQCKINSYTPRAHIHLKKPRSVLQVPRKVLRGQYSWDVYNILFFTPHSKTFWFCPHNANATQLQCDSLQGRTHSWDCEVFAPLQILELQSKEVVLFKRNQ